MKNKLLPSLLCFMLQLAVAQVNPPEYDFDSYIYTTDNENVDHLTALLTGDVGASFKVYDAAVGGNEIPSGSNLTNDTTVYAVQVVGGIESDIRLAIPVNEICTATQNLPRRSGVLNLAATPANGQTASWYTSATGGTALDDSVLLSNQTYYVEQGIAESTVELGPGFSFPNGVAIDASDNILVAELVFNGPIKRMGASGNNVVTLGSGFIFPAGIAIDASGNILLADEGNNAVKRMDAGGNNIVTLGSGFNKPHDVAVDAMGNIYVADEGNNAIKRMDANGNNIITLGSGFDKPSGVTIDALGNILVADAGNDAIKRMDANGNNMVTLGSGFNFPNSVIVDASGDIIVADTDNYTIKRMDANGNNITSLGSGLGFPTRVVVEASGNLLVADFTNNAIKRINIARRSNRVAVQVSVPIDPPTYAFDSYIYTTGNANVDNLTALLTGDAGAGFKVYDASVGGNEIISGTDLTDDTTVYAVQVVDGVDSNARLAIPVNEICAATQNLVSGARVVDLVATPSVAETASWYTTAIGGTALSSAETLSNQSYYVEQGQFESTVALGSGFNQPFGVTVDALGNILVADANNNAIKRMDASGNTIVTLGSGFSNPSGVALDASGNIYVVDTFNNAIKRMDANGNNIVTIGSGFNLPHGIALDTEGNILIADTFNNAIKRMDADGNNVVTLGSGFNLPYGVAVDASGNILVADASNNAIKRMDANGNNIVTLGSGFFGPYGVAVDAEGNILVADTFNNAIKRMDTNGNNITILGSGFNQPFGLTVDAAGNILVADAINNAIKRINLATSSNRVVVQVSLPPGPPGYAFDNYIYTTGNANVDHLTALLTGDTGASFKIYDAPTGGNEITSGNALTDDETVYAAQVLGGDESNTRLAIPVNEICEAVQNVAVGATVADLAAAPTDEQIASWYGTAIGGTALADTDVLNNGTYYVQQGLAESSVTLGSGFNQPFGVTVDAAGNIFVADAGDNTIKRMDANGNNIVSLGSGFSFPNGVAVDASGNIYIADTNNNAIKRMDASGNNIVTLGSGFSFPSGVAVDASGNIYVADTSNNAIKRMDASGNNIVTLGTGFNFPYGVAVDAVGNILVADFLNNAIKRMDANGNNIVTLGTGFNFPYDVAVDAVGNILVADGGNNAIKRMDASGNNSVTLGSGFNNPFGVAVDTSGNILVADFGNNAIKRINEAIVSNRAAVQVSLPLGPPAYAFDSYIYTTSNANVDYLTALLTGDTGASFKVYDAATDGNEITSGSDLSDNTTAYAVQVVSGNESNTRLPIPVNEICEETQNITLGATVADLTTTPTIGQIASWYTTAIGGTPLAHTETLSIQTYYVEQGQVEDIVTLGAGFNQPFDVTVDAAGNIFIADSDNNIIKRMDSSGNNIVTLGSGFNLPRGIAVDALGNILVADNINNDIKRMDASGNNIVTLGSGFNRPHSVAVDALGNIYVADTNNNAIKRMDANGNNIVTLGAGFNRPRSVAIDALGNIYVADTNNNAIKRMDANGNNIVTLGSEFNLPFGLTVDAIGNIIVADAANNVIKRMDASGNDIITLDAAFNFPSGVGVDASGNIFVADSGNNAIKRINQDIVSNRVAVQVSIQVDPPGYGFDSYIYSTGNANVNHLTVLLTGDTGASFKIYDAPVGGNEITSGTDLTDDTTVYAVQVVSGNESNTRLAIAVNEIGEATQNVSNGATVADLVVTPTNGNTSSWYTSATGGAPLADTDVLSDQTYYIEQGQASNTVTLGSGFSNPFGVGVDALGNILVADRNNNAIKRMDANGNNIVTLVSSVVSPFDVTVDATGDILFAHGNFVKRMDVNGNNIVTLGSGFATPRGVAVDASGNIYVADFGNNAIKRMDADGNNIVTLGSGFNLPRGVAVDEMGNIYVADTGNNVIKRMDASGNNIVTLGSGFNQSFDVTVDAIGNIYVADGNAIKRMDASGNNITILGSGINGPKGIALDAMGNVLVADSGSNPIKRINRATSSNRAAVQVNRYTAISDLNFEITLELLDYDDISEDGQVPTALIEGVTNLNLSNDGINDLTGIEDFTALEVLNIDQNNISAIDLTNNTALTSLLAASNNLTGIDLTNNTLLEDLRLGSNHLSTIDVSHLTDLRILQLDDNDLTEVDLSNNPLLEEVRVEANELVSFNMQNGTNTLINDFSATGNASLNCILVDDVAFAVANFTNIDNQTSFSDTNCGTNFSLALSVYLQGAALNPNTGEESLMRDDLRVGGLIPTTSPYTDALSCDANVFNTTGTDAIVDWVWIELRDATDNTMVSYSRSALLQRDGDVVDVDGTSALDFLTTNDTYHVVINHRGHLGIMTNSAITFSQGATEILNFSDATNPITYGDDAQTTFGMPSGVLGLWAGNVSGDNTVKYQGGSNDTTSIKDEVLNDAGNSSSSNLYTFAAYNNGDVDMDGVVQYQGSGNDSNVVKDTVLSHPDNQSSPSNLFIITEQLPELIMVRQLNKAFNLSLIKN